MTEEHEDSIPYYHSNISENKEKLVELATILLSTHGAKKDSFIDNEGTTPVKVLTLSWAQPELHRNFEIEQFADESAIEYGDHIMITIKNYYGDDYDEYTHVFNTSIDDNGRKDISQVTHTMKLTAEHQAEHDAWWEANRRKNGNVWFAIRPDTTDDIAYNIEMLLHAVEDYAQKVN